MQPKPGLYDAIITKALARALDDPDLVVERSAVDGETADELLARHIFSRIRAALASLPGQGAERVARQLALTNRVLGSLIDGNTTDPGDLVTEERLLSIIDRRAVGLGRGDLRRPSLPLRHSDLIVNGPRDLRVGSEIARELASADRVDVLVSFIKWNGLVELRDALQAFCDRHGARPPLRVLTTTYMGATEVQALDALEAMGAEVRVSYDTRRTRLHAKAWLFHRATGFTTAMVGSSNLSPAALRDGCEWNVRLSCIDNPAIVRKFEATFAQYWSEETFEPYEKHRFVEAVRSGRPSGEVDALARVVTLRPHPHQQVALDALLAERAAGHHRNLIVAATGTGKTVIAALDYRRRCEAEGRRPRLLFVAHRREILEQSRATWRIALRDGAFGDLLTARDRPLSGEFVFVSVQSLHAHRVASLPPDYYEHVIVDEFHHAEADTWTRLLDHLKPSVLVGLTATPERADGRSVLHWFDGRIAAEMRLWDALDKELLVPFQYFGIADGTDLSQLDFRGGRYAVGDLERVYTADEHRARQVLRGLAARVRDPHAMRALGFCVSVRHAEYMAEFFCRNGLPAAAVTGEVDAADRSEATRRLKRGELVALFTVDVFNEGVDIPEVDTVLFLRPTESVTVFLQQLGRGLRLHDGKSCLTVLDFIGRANRHFRFDQRFRALLGGGTRREVEDAIAHDFPRLPSGCSIQLEPEAREAVLANLRRVLSRWSALADDLVEDWSLATFLDRADVALDELYTKDRCFSQLRVERGYLDAAGPLQIVRSFARMLHVDDADRLSRWRALLDGAAPPEADPTCPWQRMLFAALGRANVPIAEIGAVWEELWSAPNLRDELCQLLGVLDDRRRRTTSPIVGLPLHVHATYSRDEIIAALGEVRGGKLLRAQGGVLKCAAHRCDLLFVTLDKSEADFTPTTLYNDFPMSPLEFHWESQSVTRLESETGRRYRQPPPGWRILLFVRRARVDARGVTMPYLARGPVRCQAADGERPIRIEWRLEHPMPAGWYAAVKIAAA